MDSCTKVLGDYIYQWDRWTEILLRTKRGETAKSFIGVLSDPSKIDEMIIKDFRG